MDVAMLMREATELLLVGVSLLTRMAYSCKMAAGIASKILQRVARD